MFKKRYFKIRLLFEYIENITRYLSQKFSFSINSKTKFSVFHNSKFKIILAVLLIFGFCLIAQAVELQVPIPGQPEAGKDLASYVAAWYTYGVSAISVIAVVMIMWGGMQWITAAGSASQISQAKERISNAIVGLILALCSYGLLYLINPALVELKMPEIPGIKKEEIKVVETYEYSWEKIDDCNKIGKINYADSFCLDKVGPKPSDGYSCCGHKKEICAKKSENCNIENLKCCTPDLACINNICKKKSTQGIGGPCQNINDCDYDLACIQNKCTSQIGCAHYKEKCQIINEVDILGNCCDPRLICRGAYFSGININVAGTCLERGEKGENCFRNTDCKSSKCKDNKCE